MTAREKWILLSDILDTLCMEIDLLSRGGEEEERNQESIQDFSFPDELTLGEKIAKLGAEED